jgi:hypothetical protein
VLLERPERCPPERVDDVILQGGVQPLERGFVAHDSRLTVSKPAALRGAFVRPVEVKSAHRRSRQASRLHVGPHEVVELGGQLVSRCVQERQQLRTDIGLDEPGGVSLYCFALPMAGDLVADHGDHEGDNGMGRVTFVDEVERKTRYAPEAVKVEASGIEGCSDFIVVRYVSAASAVRGKSPRL